MAGMIGLRRTTRVLTIAALVFGCACDDAPVVPDAAAPGWLAGPTLPEPVSNNAVAAVSVDGRCSLYSLLGIDRSRAATGIHSRSFVLDEGPWRAIPEVPGRGRIAASAIGLRGRIYVLGGYSVAGTGTEISHPEVDVYDPSTATWTMAAPLPTPIDDAVAVAWQDRWIVVVSGWSNTRPVTSVQIYDADAGSWSTGTPFPGTPVFGHAGALTGNDLVVIDGVGSGPGGFALVHQAWRGTLDPAMPTTIRWESLGVHPGPARYRAAAGAVEGLLVWSGGTSAPYNYDGLSYAGAQPSPPVAETLTFDLATSSFATAADAPVATMDHRAMVGCGDALTIIGGMIAGPDVTAAIWSFRP